MCSCCQDEDFIRPRLGNKKTWKTTGFWQQPDAEPCVFTVIMARIKPKPHVFTVIMARIKPTPYVFTVISHRSMKKQWKSIKTGPGQLEPQNSNSSMIISLKNKWNLGLASWTPKWSFFDDNLIENQWNLSLASWSPKIWAVPAGTLSHFGFGQVKVSLTPSKCDRVASGCPETWKRWGKSDSDPFKVW